MAARVAEKTRDEWDEAFADSDGCYAPVLSADEAAAHPQLAARGTFVEVAGVNQPAPAPRFEKTPLTSPTPPAHAGQHTDDVLSDCGFTGDQIASLRDSGAIA